MGVLASDDSVHNAWPSCAEINHYGGNTWWRRTVHVTDQKQCANLAWDRIS